MGNMGSLRVLCGPRKSRKTRGFYMVLVDNREELLNIRGF